MTDNQENAGGAPNETPMAARKTLSKKAVVAFVLGLLGIILWVPAAFAAIVLALLAKGNLRKDRSLRGRFLANFALVLGLVDLIVAPVLLVVLMVAVPPGSRDRVAHFHLSGIFVESPNNDPIGSFAGQPSTFGSLLQRLKDAKDDPAVKAVVIMLSALRVHLAEMEELHGALADFESSGKKFFVHCEDESIPLPLYATLAAASHLSVAPNTTVDLLGLYGEALYLKDALSKIGVDADIIHMGDYKSAGEMFTRDGPSDPARENMNWLFDGLYQSCIDVVAQARHKSADDVRRLIDTGVFTSDQALAAGLVDAIGHQDDLLTLIKQNYGDGIFIDNNYHRLRAPEISVDHPLRSFGSVAAYFLQKDLFPSRGNIGLIYVDGMIVSGYNVDGATASGDLRYAFKTAMEDKSIKAVVLRVNSPGGSAGASEEILHAAQLLQEKKPLIVSMGGVAASGGYYVSCRAKTVFADETTLTGSIGVVGGKLISGDLWKKLGINWFPYQRGTDADLFSTSHAFTDSQRAKVTAEMEAIYKTFKTNVEAGRGTHLKKAVDELAGGRVYTGKQALDLGLIDKIGGLQAALDFAAESVSIKKYKVRVIPEPKDIVQIVSEAFFGEPHSRSDLQVKRQPRQQSLQLLSGTSARESGIASLLESFDPLHADGVLEMLRRFHVISQEDVATVMPELVVFP